MRVPTRRSRPGRRPAALVVAAACAAGAAPGRLGAQPTFVENMNAIIQAQVMGTTIRRANGIEPRDLPNVCRLSGGHRPECKRPQAPAARGPQFPVAYDPTRSFAVRAAWLDEQRARPQPVTDGRWIANYLRARTPADFDDLMDTGGLGLASTDLADVIAVTLAQRYAMARDARTAPDREQVQAVRAQVVASGVAARTSANLASPEARQRLAERLTLDYQRWTVFRNMAVNRDEDPNTEAAVRAAARASLRALGIDVDAVRLTADGFVPNGRPSAPPPPAPVAP